MKTSAQTTGKHGEDLAVDYLQSQGFQIVERNWSPCRWGEIDIVTVDKDTLVFVEVKTRKGDSHISPQASLTYRQKNKLRSLALLYGKSHSDLPKALRIDLIGITYFNSDSKPQLEHFLSIID